MPQQLTWEDEMNAADLRAQIERARELLRPSPVRQDHRPAWLMRYLRPLRDRYGSSAIAAVTDLPRQAVTARGFPALRPRA